MQAVKSQLKQVVKRSLGQPVVSKWMLKKTLSVFVYHDVTDRPTDFSREYHLNVPPALFARQMDFIKGYFNLVTPDQVLGGNYETPAALVTFDDGTPSYFQEAAPIMTARQIPSILFLNMAPIEGEIFWSGLITYLSKYDPAFCKKVCQLSTGQDGVPDYLRCDVKMVKDYLETIDQKALLAKVRRFYGDFAGKEDFESVKDNPFVFFGNHLYNHYNAAKLSDEALSEQFRLNQQRIDRMPQGRPFFAFPFGQPGMCFLPHQPLLIEGCGAKLVFSSSGRINFRRGKGFYDRVGVDDSITALTDLLGRIQAKRLKIFLRR